MFLLGLLVVLVAIGGYLTYQTVALSRENASLTTTLATTNAELASTTALLNDTKVVLASTKQDLIRAQNDLHAEQAKVGNLTNQVQNIAGAVGTLTKLQNTDPELLEKYSKVSFLNENYIPKKLLQIDPVYIYEKRKDLWVLDQVKPFLEGLLKDANARGLNLRIASAYRSFDEQSSLKSSYRVVYGSGANQFSADQGYSEHQLGTAVDFILTDEGGLELSFADSDAYTWLLENAYRYGFVLSYPKDNSYYQFEPWHWRFVGRQLANVLHAQNKHFYDLDQRDIDQYLVSIFD